MNLKGFLETYPSVLFGTQEDEVFSTFRLLLNGMCSFKMAKLLNHACRFLKDDECYLEIGTYAGYSLLSAGYESSGHYIGVDNFSEEWSMPGSIKQRLSDNLKKYPGDYLIMEHDFRQVDLAGSLGNKKAVGVYLIDGKHDYQDVVDSIAWAGGSLSDEALVVFDDINIAGVKEAVEEIKSNDEFEEVFFANSFYDPTKDKGMRCDPYIHNGFSLMTFRRKGA